MTSPTADYLSNCVLTVYPLSQGFKERVLEIAGSDARVITINDLRRRGARGALGFLRSFRIERVYIPVEDHESLAVLPILKLVGGVMRARSIVALDADLIATRVPRSDLFATFLRVLGAILVGKRQKSQAAREMALLRAAQRIDAPTAASRNIVYLNTNLWLAVKAGGSFGHISGVINALLEAHYPVHFVSAGGRLHVRNDVSYSRLEPPKNLGATLENDFYRFGFEIVDQAAKLCEGTDFGFIYQRLSLCNYSGVMLSRQVKKPLVIEYNGSEVWIAKNWGRALRDWDLAERVEETNLQHAHLIVTQSKVLEKELIARNVDAKRIVCYPNCIDPEIFDPARFDIEQVIRLRHQHAISPDAVVVTFVGTFGPWHGTSVLATAIRDLIEEREEWIKSHKLHFLFVGDGFEMPKVREILGSHAGGPYVAFAGLVAQDRAPAYLAASDILCSPHVPNADGSNFFGSPTKLCEYMAMGKAIIASNLDQLAEVLDGSLIVGSLPAPDQKPTGSAPSVLAAPCSARELMDGIVFLTGRPEWRALLGMNARRLALERYTWKHHVGAILDRARDLGIIAPD